jgi:hypothetical protein
MFRDRRTGTGRDRKRQEKDIGRQAPKAERGSDVSDRKVTEKDGGTGITKGRGEVVFLNKRARGDG